MNTVLYSLLDNSDSRDHKIITIPNELILTTAVENHTKESNFVLEELSIAITYESDHHKAIKIISKIAEAHLQKIKNHIKKDETETLQINSLLTQRYKRKNENSSTTNNERVNKELTPKVRIEMADSAVILIVYFVSPYYAIKKNRTQINLAFLDAIAQDPSIEVAYPHMKLIYNTDKS